MMVQPPKLFDAVEPRDLTLAIFPWFISVRMIVPQVPTIFQRMFHQVLERELTGVARSGYYLFPIYKFLRNISGHFAL